MAPSRHFPFFLFLFDFDRLTLASDIDGYSFSLSLLRNLVALECAVPLNLTEFSKRVVVSLLQRYDFPEWSRRRLVQEGSGLSDSTTQKPGGQPWWCWRHQSNWTAFVRPCLAVSSFFYSAKISFIIFTLLLLLISLNS